MPTLKARIVKLVMRMFYRPMFDTPESLMKAVEKSRRTTKPDPPPCIRDRVDITESTVSGRTVYHVTPKSAKVTSARIMYLHGGAFVFEIVDLQWKLIANLAQRLNATVEVPIYPLAPEHTLTEVYDFLQPIYDEMASASTTATNDDIPPFWAMGDSAGGTLSLGLTQMALQQGKPVADKLAVFSPAIDCTMVNPELHVKAKTDPWLNIPGLMEALRLLMGDIRRDDFRLSPLFGPIEGLPPMLMLIAEDDLLGPDEEIFAAKAKEKGVDIEVFRGQGMIHAWIGADILHEAHVAQDKVVEWATR